MTILCGKNSFLKNKILNLPSLKEKSVYEDNDILILNDTDENYTDILIRSNTECIFAAEGNILKKIHFPFQMRDDIDIWRHLEGYFNLLVWDKIKKKGIFVNDKLGLNPLYYTIIGNSLAMSTRLRDLLNLTGVEKQIDTIALSQFALFNYFLGSRTFIKGINRLEPGTVLKWENGKITHERYWDAGNIIKEEPLPEEEAKEKISEMLHKVISEWILGKKRIGILLSGGYDSRAILACLCKMGVKGYAYTWDNPKIKEMGVAKRLAERTGFSLKYLPFYPPIELTAKLIYEAERETDYLFPLFHIGRFHAVKIIGNEVDILFSGQGELIRATPLPNDYINNNTISCILKQNTSAAGEKTHFFNLSDEAIKIAFDDFIYKDFNTYEKLTLFLLYNAYRDDYGILRYGESFFTTVVMPFLDARIIEILLKSPISLARLKSWDRNLITTFKNRKMYFEIIRKNAPELLEIPLDRGYKPKYDNCFLGILFTVIWGLRETLSSKIIKASISPWEYFIKNLLSEKSVSMREFYDQKRVLKSLKKNKPWDPTEAYELEKVARFELWYRSYIENR
jgi:asparagine synthetase B (glutamine-hydrolysing)